MSAALRARVRDGQLVVVRSTGLPEGMEFDLVPVQPSASAAASMTPAIDRAPTLLDLIGCDLPNEAFEAVHDRSQALPRDFNF